MTTVRPVMVKCAVSSCRAEVYPHNLAVVRYATVKDGERVSHTVAATWCARCDRQRCAEGRQVLRDEIEHLRELVLDDVSTERRVCGGCKQSLPLGSFKVAFNGKRGHCYYRSQCRACLQSSKRSRRSVVREQKQTPPVVLIARSPYTLARRVVEGRSGKNMRQWGQDEHEHHCVLMRELAGIPHGRVTFANRSSHLTVSTPDVEARWAGRVNATWQWAGTYGQHLRPPTG